MLPNAKRLAFLCLLTLLGLQGCATAPVQDRTVPAAPLPEPSGATFQLTLRFQGLEADRGQIAAALYADAAGFDGEGPPHRSVTLPVAGSEVTWTLSLEPGAYAVKVYQDLDSDGELGRGDFGVPNEPYGFSNDARSTFGPPGWTEARFELSTDAEHQITVR